MPYLPFLHLVTLPVEINASQRALAWLSNSNVTGYDTYPQAKDALKWAAYTYVVAALVLTGHVAVLRISVFGQKGLKLERYLCGVVARLRHNIINLYMMSALNNALFVFLLLVSISCSGSKQAGKAAPQNPEQMTNNNAEALKELSHFPQAKKGYERFVMFPDLQGSADAKSVKIEIIPGKTIMADCNRYALIGKLNEAAVEGWGYAYYEYISDGQMISTKMACPDYPLEERFIPGESRMLNYIKDVPIVVYVPQGFTVKYRIWNANETKEAVTM